MADQQIDQRYASLRRGHGATDAAANGYRANWFFRLESDTLRALLAPRLTAAPTTVLDVGAGSGLMLAAVQSLSSTVRWVAADFNADACLHARKHTPLVVRADAFELPFADNSIDVVVNCQFLNEQSKNQRTRFLGEATRVLRDRGRLIVVWRNAESALHRIADRLLRAIDARRGRPLFPQHCHPIADVANDAPQLLIEQQFVTTLAPDVRLRAGGRLARLIGASNVLVLTKPAPL